MTSTDSLATDIGTIIDGTEAVKEGIIDQIGGLKDALAKLRELIANQKNEPGS